MKRVIFLFLFISKIYSLEFDRGQTRIPVACIFIALHSLQNILFVSQEEMYKDIAKALAPQFIPNQKLVGLVSTHALCPWAIEMGWTSISEGIGQVPRALFRMLLIDHVANTLLIILSRQNLKRFGLNSTTSSLSYGLLYLFMKKISWHATNFLYSYLFEAETNI